MKRLVTLAAVAALFILGCGTQASASPQGTVAGSPPPSTLAGDVGRYFTIEEIGLGPNGWVTLHNYTQSDASLGSLYLCQPPQCVQLPDVLVKAGALARIAVGSGDGLQDVAMTDARLTLDPIDGEVALYSTGDYRDASHLWAYLEWGKTPHQGTRTAIKAGLWHEGSYAPTSPTATRLFRTDGGLWVFE